MNDDQKVDITEKVDLNNKVSGKRRLFVKGAAGAVPAVLTLRSGAAFALNSSEMCVTKENGQAAAANPAILIENNTPDDIWVRTQIDVRRVRLASGGGQFWVYEDPDNPGVWRHENYVVGSSDPGDNTRTFSDTILPSPNDMVEVGVPGVYYKHISTRRRYILVIMDPQGKPIDIGKSAPTANGLPYISGSCWASASPGLV